MHEGAGNGGETVRDWFLQKYPEAKDLPWKTKTREGIVHRLDKDTPGILIIAKTPEALDYFQNQFKNREIKKHYTCLVYGKPPFKEGEINALIRRDPRDRERQKVELMDFGMDEQERKASATKYKTLKAFYFKKQPLTLLDVQILTGRKHQIRAHMKYIGCPVIGDQKYFTKPSRRLSKELGLSSQLLHATKLKFKDYPSGKVIKIEDELPEIFNKTISALVE